MNSLKTSPPSVDIKQATQLLEKHYDLRGKLTQLPSERDQNFRIDCESGKKYTLKISNSAETELALQFQNALLAKLAHSEISALTPQLVQTLDAKQCGYIETAGGDALYFRLLNYLPGIPIGNCTPTGSTFETLGSTLGKMSSCLRAFGHPGAFSDLDWDLRHADRSRQRMDYVQDKQEIEVLTYFLKRFDSQIKPQLESLRCAVIHNDASDWNVLVDPSNDNAVCGLIDFGDAMHTIQIAELAIAATYAIMGNSCPLAAAAQITRAYHAEFALEEIEADLLFDLIAARLCISVTMAAMRRPQGEATDHDVYLLSSEANAWKLLHYWRALDPTVARAVFRHACEFPAAKNADKIAYWINSQASKFAPILNPSPAMARKALLPWADANHPLTAATVARDFAATQNAWLQFVDQQQVDIGIGAYAEKRSVYITDAFASRIASDERRDLHLGLDIFADALTLLHAPIDAVIHEVHYADQDQDYGGTVILRHEPELGLVFYSLWGHLRKQDADASRIGLKVKRGEAFAAMGAEHENGGWLPHVHLQLIVGDFEKYCDTPGVGESRFIEIWQQLFPDPNTFAGIAPEFYSSNHNPESLRARRTNKLNRALSLAYQKPLHLLRGEGMYLFDHQGRAYLDCFNNVAHVGHCHPAVVEAIAKQSALLNTNTRYLQENILEYAERLCATFPTSLDTCSFACTGSEANDLAVRMARTITGRKDVLIIDWAYHGNTQSLLELSPYKYKRKGGFAKPNYVHELAMPDMYRATIEAPADQLGEYYARSVEDAVAELVKAGTPPAAFIFESIITCGGLVFLPPQYLQRAFAAVRAAGGLCIADEVQVGFGRVGTHCWAFEQQNVVPDIVTLGKPIGNGHPLSALVTSSEIAESFNNGMEYFNTFGGNPVSCAAGLAVLDVLSSEHLQANALKQGAALLQELRALQNHHHIIGDVRGTGLFIGIELVNDRNSKTPATASAQALVEYCRNHGVLLGSDGPHNNVIKLRPPMIFSDQHRRILLDVLNDGFSQIH